MIKLKDLLFEKKKKLTVDDVEVGDAYHVTTHVGYVVTFVYEKQARGGVTTIEFQFKPQYGKPYFAAVGSGPYHAVNRWGKSKKIKVKAKMKKIMAKELNDAINSKYNGSEETDVLLRNRSLVGSLYSVLGWVKKL